jgi:hypothetical protein
MDGGFNLWTHQAQALEMMRCFNIALLCVQENAVDRPTMTNVVAMHTGGKGGRGEASSSAEQCRPVWFM